MRLRLVAVQRPSVAGIWMAAAGIAVLPLIITEGVSHPRPDLDELILQLAAGTLPGLYFGFTTWIRADVGVSCVDTGVSWVRTRLSMLSRFAAAAMIAIALGAVTEAGAWGLYAALPAVAIAIGTTVGTRLLDLDRDRDRKPSRDREPSWARRLGIAAVIAGYLTLGVICLRWHIIVGYDNIAVDVIGAMAVTAACAAGILAAATFTGGRSGRSQAPVARDRAG
jgi:hypothetical protein